MGVYDKRVRLEEARSVYEAARLNNISAEEASDTAVEAFALIENAQMKTSFHDDEAWELWADIAFLAEQACTRAKDAAGEADMICDDAYSELVIAQIEVEEQLKLEGFENAE